MKFYDAEKGFGYLTQDSGGADVYVGKAALHTGVDGLAHGNRVEFEVSQGRRGPLARSVRPLGTGPETAPRKTAAQLDVLIKDMIGLLDAVVLPKLGQGRYPERSSSQRARLTRKFLGEPHRFLRHLLAAGPDQELGA